MKGIFNFFIIFFRNVLQKKILWVDLEMKLGVIALDEGIAIMIMVYALVLVAFSEKLVIKFPFISKFYNKSFKILTNINNKQYYYLNKQLLLVSATLIILSPETDKLELFVFSKKKICNFLS